MSPSDHGNILLVGLCCIDEIYLVQKYPNEDSETRVFERWSCLGGNVANSAVVLRQLTPNVQICASLPVANLQLFSLLKDAAIDTSLTIQRTDPMAEIPVSTCIVNESTGSRTVFHYRGNLPEINETEFASIVLRDNVMPKLGWIHFEGRNFDNLKGMMEKIHQYGSLKRPVISVEFEKIRNFTWFEKLIPLVDVVFMSKDFAKNKGWSNGSTAIQQLRLKYALHADISVICPWGEQGVYGSESKSTEIHHIPGKIITVIDSLGAGDCFIGACIWALWSGKSFIQSLEIANNIAANKCTQRGLKNLVKFE